ncbi:MAG: DUF2442 domain-containing protein [Kiritimatiellae bacterium]|nr:DUF2442 domain-containing protein [Kiritimatiellia bacterium]
MSSQMLGENTSLVEVTHMDIRGFWLYVDGTEHYLPFDDFPWFANATVRQICHIERYRPHHFHWPDIDVDLTLDMIDHPDKYPLKYT